jgi:UDP-N-acetylglucosamine 2-epimerase (non-hydrolysing)
MIDTLLANEDRFVPPAFWDELQLKKKEYLVMTLHRPANVDEEGSLKALMTEIINHSRDLPLVFPVHPRTAKILSNLKINHPRLNTVDPLGYLEFNYLVKNAKAVVTDSGGITEETTVLGVPCMTLRNNTERPETVTMGTNALIGTDPKAIAPAMDLLFENKWKSGTVPPLWDGHTAERLVQILINLN